MPEPIYLTFDDGPANETVLVLDALQAHGARATFFQVGARVAEQPELSRRAAAAGHALGNHTWSHPNLRTEVDDDGIRRELADTSDTLEQVTGCRPHLFRPPYGEPWWNDVDGPDVESRRALVGRHVTALGMTVLLWDVDPRDWDADDGRTAEDVAAEVVRDARAGDVVHLHDVHARTAAVVPLILDGRGARGFAFEPVPPGTALVRSPRRR